MRVIVTVLIASAAAARADGDATNRREAELEAMTAANLARDGHCHEAVALRPQIAALDADVASHAFSDNAVLAACVAQQPAGTEGPALEAPVLPPRGHCSSGLYLSPSFVVAFGTRSTALHRLAAGVTIRSCSSPMVFSFGGTGFLGGPDGGGGGGELEVSRWTGSAQRIGGHAALESLGNGGYLASVDLRLHVEDVLWVGAGVSGGRDQYGGRLIDGTIGVGVEGKPGAVVGAVELGVGAILVGVVLYSWSHSRE